MKVMRVMDAAQRERVDKSAATLIAAFAIAGVCVYRLEDGGFIACRANVSHKLCGNVDELRAFAHTTGVKP